MFNALYDPWIPVEYTDHTRTELGILDTLTHSDRIRTIADDAPTARAIERLLIAVVYHATAPARWRRLLHDGIDIEAITAYLQPRARAFDLNRFLQTADTPASPRARIDMRRLHLGSADMFRPHQDNTPATPARAIRLALTRLLWDDSGIRSGITGDRGGKSMPIGPAYLATVPTTIANASTLARTIALNMPEAPTRAGLDDAPIWDDEPARARRIQDTSDIGPGRALIYPARRITLAITADQTITGALLSNGDRLRGTTWDTCEPHGLLYRTHGRTKNAPDQTVPRSRRTITPWACLIDTGAPLPIGIARALTNPDTIDDRIYLRTTWAILDDNGQTQAIRDATLPLRLDAHTPTRIDNLRIINAIIDQAAYLYATGESLHHPEWTDADVRTRKERHGEVIAAQFAPDISWYLSGDDHSLTQIRRALIDTAQEAENQVIITTMRAPHRTSPDGTTGTVIAAAARNLIDSIDALTITPPLS